MYQWDVITTYVMYFDKHLSFSGPLIPQVLLFPYPSISVWLGPTYLLYLSGPNPEWRNKTLQPVGGLIES